MENLLIYVSKKTARIRYTFKLVFTDILLMDYTLTSDLDAFLSADGPKMQYSSKPFSDDLYFQSNEFLLIKGIHSVDLDPFEYDGIKVFFSVKDKMSELPFDVFSAIFYLVVRYEEYLPFVKDQHGRFTAHKSISHELGFLQKHWKKFWTLA